jgi:hypothetical protein
MGEDTKKCHEVERRKERTLKGMNNEYILL